MIKQFITLLFISFSICARSQEIGYTTTDVGGEFQYTPDFNSFNLHVAFNARLNSSFVIRGGYNSAGGQRTKLHNGETGSGWNASVGYRYHFSYIPKRFFLGVRAGIQTMNIHWSTELTEGTSKVMVLQPGVEAGYTLVINDLFFITPLVSGIYQKTISTTGEKVSYGDNFVPGAGISMGWRF